MKIALIVAMARNRVIGLNQQMPWHLSADLKKFKQITMGHPIIMGRKTFEAIGHPLPGRRNIIISRNPDYQAPDCVTYNHLDSALQSCQNDPIAFIIGGATLYEATLERADLIYLTEIHREFSGDTWFPDFDRSAWQEIDRQDITQDEAVDFHYSFITLQRLSAC